MTELKYLSGFGNEFASESLPNSLPFGQNSPQKCAYGLYAEQLSGTAFTAPRFKNQRTWLYKIHPSVKHGHYSPLSHPAFDNTELILDPNQHRWLANDLPEAQVDFIEGIEVMCASGEPLGKSGLSIYVYAANKSMNNRVFHNSDGDFLIVPQLGTLKIKTEMGHIHIEPTEIAVIQRGIKFSVDVDGPVRGYILEVFSGHFVIPDLGPIGANGLANPRDFLTPVAAYEDLDTEHILINKFGGKLFQSTLNHSPFDVVAWHGNYAPYKYDLKLFCCMNSVTYDHPDPSIYTVLTCQSYEAGTAVADFVIFPNRWMVMQHSFRPPYFHRNTMSEYMGLINGVYDNKAKGFLPGGSSLHLTMTPHGPDTPTFEKASNEGDENGVQQPVYFSGGLAFMFETCFILKVASNALNSPKKDLEYLDCWQDLPKLFNPNNHSI
mmetsp:Transcript_17303/g.18044  ORF Transcript_17303/g.18044 Transcript_17303/m.18044 type:complete len:436 (+) Transcript_17303:145-1452(+)